MMRPVDRADIQAAELRVARSRSDTRDSLARVRRAAMTALARPSTLLAVAAVAGLATFFLARRTKPATTASSDGVAVTAAKTSAIGLLLAFLLRYALQRLPEVLRYVWRTSQKPAAPQRREPMRSATHYPASDLQH